MDSHPSVLVVDDQREITRLYREFLEEEYAVRAATSGEEALDELDDSIDVVLLDRRMPGLSGDEVLERINQEGYECRVAVVTAVEPDFDIVDMGFDDYVVKPVGRAELVNIVDSLLHWDAYDALLQEYFTVASKVSLLESEKTQAELATSDEYGRLTDRLEELDRRADEELSAIVGHTELGDMVQSLDVGKRPSDGQSSATSMQENL